MDRPGLSLRRYLLWGPAFLVLALQLGAIAYARFTPARYFCWAPYDNISRISVEVTVDGRSLDKQRVRKRYRHSTDRENRSIQHLKDLIQQYETTYGRNDRARVVLRYRTNGHAEQQWHWPPNR